METQWMWSDDENLKWINFDAATNAQIEQEHRAQAHKALINDYYIDFDRQVAFKQGSSVGHRIQTSTNDLLIGDQPYKVQEQIRHVELIEFKRFQSSIDFTFAFNGKPIKMVYNYDVSINFELLEEQLGMQYMKSIYFHIVAFEANKFTSLKPNTIDMGYFNDCITEEFKAIWYKVIEKAWAQWRFENDAPTYLGPTIIGEQVPQKVHPVILEEGQVETLLFCSGGKDSLVCLNLLQQGGITYDTLTYASTIYGDQESQHQNAQRILQHYTPKHRREQNLDDQFFSSGLLEDQYIDVKTLLAAETPSSIFASLPYVLAHKYKYITVGHERSANSGQMYWDLTKEDINHQWGKSYEAEELISNYIQNHLIQSCRYFSILQPIHDVLIFALLNSCLQSIQYTNSCNMGVVSCQKCAKCLYVYLGYLAFLPGVDMQLKFNDNLLDMQHNQLLFNQLLGIEEHLPFECIGQQSEIQLYFHILLRNGKQGKAIDTFKTILKNDYAANLQNYSTVSDQHMIPKSIADKIMPIFHQISQWVKQQYK